MEKNRENRSAPVVAVIVIFGIISLLGDAVYESARSANSQYLNLLAVSASQVGLIFGIGEFLGYFLRMLSGVLADKSGRPWLFLFLGYGLLISVPLMGMTRHWNILMVLILTERIGKALRSPAKDTILSNVADGQVGIGFAFGLQEALDQIGAFAGPLIFTAVFFWSGKNDAVQYQLGYKLLMIPFAMLLLFLAHAYRKITRNRLVPEMMTREFRADRLRQVFWIYAAFTLFCTLGLVNFSLIGYHLKANHLMADGTITLLYSVSMAVDALAAVVMGNGYDRLKKKSGRKTGGLAVLMSIPLIIILLPFLTLGKSVLLISIGMILFGLVIGTHETIMRSAIADITPFNKRGTGYGIFNTFYGLALFGGAAIMGWLYDRGQLHAIMGLSCLAEAAAVVLFVRMKRLIGGR
jgi:MFS family permease